MRTDKENKAREHHLSEIASLIASGKVVPVIGADVSQAMAGIPGWTGILESGFEYIEIIGTHDDVELAAAMSLLTDPVAAAQKMFELLGGPYGEYPRWLKKTFEKNRADIVSSEVIDAVIALRCPLIATTNYDKLIGIAHPEDFHDITWRQPALMQVALQDGNKIFHLHGVYDDPSSVVFGIGDYAAIVKDDAYKAVLQTLWLDRTLLFIGCSFDGVTDRDFEQFLTWTTDSFRGSPFKHYALLRDGDYGTEPKQVRELLHDRGIQVVKFGTEYDGLPTWLRDLAQRVELRQSSFTLSGKTKQPVNGVSVMSIGGSTPNLHKITTASHLVHSTKMDHLGWNDLVRGENNHWYEYNDSDNVIVFVHGFFSESKFCWLHENPVDPTKNTFWPDLIRQDQRLMAPSQFLGGYYSTLDSGGYGFRNCSDELYSALERPDEFGNPRVMDKGGIIFVCHSMGGIVVRNLLVRHREHFTSKRVGLLLIASPSYGSTHADRLAWLARLYNHEQGLHLRWGDAMLKELDADFKDLVDSRKLPNLIGVEACENHFIMHRKFLPDKAVVVTAESAGRYFGAAKLLRETNHFTAVKPSGLRHPSHELVVDFWRRYSPTQPQVIRDKTRFVCGNRPTHEVVLESEGVLLDAHGLVSDIAPTDPKNVPALSPGLDGYHDNLPAQVTTFVGRENDVRLVKQLLRKNRIVTLRGVGGVGKSYLALQVARQLVGSYAEGAWLVEMAALSDPTLVVQVIASTLGVREISGVPLIKTLSGHLRTKRLLLVLDNCEHLLHACARICSDLLRTCPQISILATSRELLGIPEEQLYGVPSLSMPDPTTALSIKKLAQFGAIKLFIDRAVAIHPSFSITAENARAIVAVCHRLDGIPLALVLAASQMRTTTVEKIAAEVNERFDLLDTDSSATFSRQQTLHASIDWSYILLHDEEQIAFTRLSVFAGGWTVDAAQGVCQGDGLDMRKIPGLLKALEAKSLIVADPHGPSVRFRMLETVRLYAMERLSESGQVKVVQARHAEWFAQIAELAKPHWHGPQQRSWFERFEEEHDNFRVALGWSRVGTDGGMIKLRLVAALYWFWEVRGYLNEAQRHLEEALNTTMGLAQTEEYAIARNTLAVLLYVQGQYDKALPLARLSVKILWSPNNRQEECASLSNLGNILRRLGQYDEASGLHQASLKIATEIGNTQRISEAYKDLGQIAMEQKNYDGAWELFMRSLELRRQTGDLGRIGILLNNLSSVAYYQGKYTLARELVVESLPFKQENGDQRGLAYYLERIACLNAISHAYERSAVLFGAAMTIRESIGAVLPPSEKKVYDEVINGAKAAIKPKNRWRQAWTFGRGMNTDQAVEYSINVDGR